MGKPQRVLHKALSIVGAVVSIFGLWQVTRVTWAILNPPPPGKVFEPLIPWALGLLILVLGISFLALARALGRRHGEKH